MSRPTCAASPDWPSTDGISTPKFATVRPGDRVKEFRSSRRRRPTTGRSTVSTSAVYPAAAARLTIASVRVRSFWT